MSPTVSSRVLIVDDSNTVRRVVERTLARAGYDVVIAVDGRQGIEHAQRYVPDLVLVDLTMPGVDGQEFCRMMRGIANLKDVPVVLMSARAERLDEQTMATTGAIDAIKKPFGPEALLAVTAHALTREPSGASTEVDLPAPDFVTEVVDPDAERLMAARALTERLAVAIGPALRGADMCEARDEDIAMAIRDGLEWEQLFSLVTRLTDLLPGATGEASFEGRLDHVSLGEILQMVQHQRQTGVLTVEYDERAVQICLSEGMVDIAIARASEPEFRLGRYLLEEGLIEREDLELLLKRRAGSRRLLGAQLVKLGYINADDVRRALVRQTSELTYEALRWQSGRYRFAKYARRPEAEDAKLGLPIASVLMEGLRRVDEWRLIEEQVENFAMVLRVDRGALEAADRDRMRADERRVLDAVDSERTVRDIIEHTAMSSFDVCKVLFQLMTSGLIKKAR